MDRLQHSQKTVAHTTFNNDNVTGDMVEYKQCSYSLRKAIKNGKNVCTETKWSRNSSAQTRRMWQGLQTITDYKGKTSHATATDVLLPGKLNIFFARFEDNTATDAASYQGLWALLLLGRRK